MLNDICALDKTSMNVNWPFFDLKRTSYKIQGGQSCRRVVPTLFWGGTTRRRVVPFWFLTPLKLGGGIFFESTLEYEFHMSRKRISFQIFDRLWEFPPTEFLKRGIFAHFYCFFGGPPWGSKEWSGLPKVFFGKNKHFKY